MKEVIFMLLVTALCHCNAAESTTQSPVSTTMTSAIEKEDDNKLSNRIPPVRMMPLMQNFQPAQRSSESRDPGAVRNRNTRVTDQGAQNNPEMTSSRDLQLRNRGTVPRQPESRQNTDISSNRNLPQNPRTGFGSRSGRENFHNQRAPIDNREDDRSQLAPVVERGMGRPLPTMGASDDDNERDARYLNPAIDNRGTQTESPIGRSNLGNVRGSTFYRGTQPIPSSFGNQPPTVRQDMPLNRHLPGVSRRMPFGDRDDEEPESREDGSDPFDGNRVFPSGQGPRVGYDGTWTSYRRYGVGSQDPGVLYNAPEEHEHRPYSFNYISEDDDGMHGHQQSADESGKVIGSYAISLGDGRKRIVEYIADENGFRASIDTNEPGTSNNENPADIVYYNTPGVRTSYSPSQDHQPQNRREQPTRTSRTRPSFQPATPNTYRGPTYRFGDPHTGPVAARSEDSQEKPVPESTADNDASGAPGYVATRRYPLNRRLQDPEENNLGPSEYAYQGTVPRIASAGRALDDRNPARLPSESGDAAESVSSTGEFSRRPSPARGVHYRPPINESPNNQTPQQGNPSELPMYRSAQQQPSNLQPQPMAYIEGNPAEESFMNGGITDQSYNNGNRYWFYRN